MAAKEQAVLEVSVTGVDKAASQFSSFQQTTTKTMSASEAAVSRSLKNMVSQFVGVAAAARAVQNVVSSGIGFNQFVENTTTSFTVMMKSAEKAKAQMKDLYDFAVSSPLTFKETAASSKQLMAYGFTAEQLIPTMKTLGSVAIATGHSLDDIAYVYGTLKSQGRAYSRDLMQFGMRGIPIYEELAKVMNVNVNQIQKMASEGKIGFEEVEKAFENMTTGSGRFSGVIEGYMTTLTGKLSMLGDIAEQSAGTLMKGVTDQLKILVTQLASELQSTGFQDYIKGISNDLGGITAALGTVLTAVIKLLPLLTTFVKLWVTFKALKLATEVLGSLPKLLLSIGDALVMGGIALNGFTASAAAFSATLTTAFASALTGLKLLTAEIAVFVAANPWILALVGVTAAVATGVVAVNKIAESRRTSTNPNVRAQQLTSDYTSTYGTRKITVAAEDVAKIAEQYKLTEGFTASLLKNTGALSANAWQQYVNTKSANLALQEQQKIAKGLQHTSTTIEQDQMTFLSGLTGKDASIYEDLSNVDLNALGNNGAKDYIAGFKEARQREKDIFGFAYSEDQLKASLEAEAKGLTSALEQGANVKGLFDTKYDETLRARLDEVNDELELLGKKAKKLEIIGIYWAPFIKAAEATIDVMDNIEVATGQAIDNAQNEFLQRQANLQLQLDAAATDEQRFAIQQKITTEAEAYAKVLDYIVKAGEKQKNLAAYNQALSGNNPYWENMQASAGAAYRGGNYGKGAAIQGATQMLQGTETGNIISSAASGAGIAGVVGQAVTAFTSMINSIENVSKVLNPFATIMEAAKTLLEPLLNNALLPLVQILTQFGTVIGQILAPFVGILKIVNVLVYLVLTPLVALLNIVGGAFEWLYNFAIVPFGNGVILVTNGFITAINLVINALNNAFGWAGLHIAQVEYIDNLKTTTELLKDLSDTISNQKEALDDTISYLTDKINKAVDDQVKSLQDLYDVGAISATNYDAQVKALNAQKISTENIMVSSADMALTGRAMYDRLYQLYAVKDAIENNKSLTEEQVSKILTDAGLSSASRESLIMNAIKSALEAYGAAKGTLGTGTTGTGVVSSTVTNGWGNAITAGISTVTAAATAATVAATSGTNIVETVVDGLKKDPGPIGVLARGLGGLLGFAAGTSKVPYDMTAQIHQGEGIVPATFMDSIRSGELTLSGGANEGSGQTVIVNVTVEGSVQTERDLAASIANNIYTMRKQRIITV